ncbi:MAG: EamA family transporter [Bacteroidota bacterium]
MAYTQRRAYLELHLAVFLWGFTAILGDLISLSALTLVWWRVFLTSLSILPFARLGSLVRETGQRKLWILAGIGLLTGLHWVCFYGSIKLANASIALICMATTSLFSSLLEPLIVKRPFQWVELLLGIFILPGIYLITTDSGGGMTSGILVGLAAAFLAALFTTLNKRYMGDTSSARITLVELGAATLFLPLFFIFQAGDAPFWPQPQDWLYLLVLALVCTTFTFFLSLRALRELSAFATNLSINLEPVYGIILAHFLLNDADELNGKFYIGALIILLGVFSYPFLKKVGKRKTSR